MKELLEIFFTFAKIGVMTFGGGYAMLPIIQNEVVEKKKWATNEEVIDYYAIGQCTPGVIAVNTATFIGYKLRGILGGVFATVGVVFPSIIIISLIAMFLSNFNDLQVVKHAFGGIRVAVVALIITSVIKIWKNSVKNSLGKVIAIMSFLLAVVISLSPVYIVLIAALGGVSFELYKGGFK